MRQIERPPYIHENWEYSDLLNDIPADRYEAFREMEENAYPYWEKWKYLAKEWGLDPRRLWNTVKQGRHTRRRINFTGVDGFRMDINSPSVMQEQLHFLDLNLGGSLHTSDLIPEEEKQRYLVSSLMEEAIASSQLEGAATTRRVAKDMLENTRKPTNPSEQMIANNYAAMQWIVAHKKATMTPALILELHRLITRETLQSREEEGFFRTTDDVLIRDVQTGQAVHTPPSSADLPYLMEEFCRFANDEKKQTFFLHPIAKSTILHFLTGYIHPFADGNGRTARALFYWYLIRKGYWLIEYMSVSRIILASKAQYTRAYQYVEFDEYDLTYFVLYSLKVMKRALEDLVKYIERKNREKKQLFTLIRDTEYNDRQLVLVQEMLEGKKNQFTVKALVTRFGVSDQTARNDLNKMVQKAILQPRKKGSTIVFLQTANALQILKAGQ